MALFEQVLAYNSGMKDMRNDKGDSLVSSSTQAYVLVQTSPHLIFTIALTLREEKDINLMLLPPVT